MINGIVSAITGTFTELGTAILSFLKLGFQVIFLEGTVANGVFTPATNGSITDLGTFIFAMLGISLVVGLTRWVTSLVRRKI